MKAQLFLISICLTLLGCSISHNIPQSQAPNRQVSEDIFNIFVDQNGSFFPENWEEIYGGHNKKGAYSLNTLAIRKGIKDFLVKSESEIIESITNIIANRKRVIILVHGYNNNESQAAKSFNRIQEIITQNSKSDIFLEFYWDGLVAHNASSIKIWFNATGYSQLAGEFGLRKVLNTIKDKEIIIISHSRGASVVLSALSNPPYSPDFIRDTRNFHSIEIGSGEILKENNNFINCIMLAPAVGDVDFQTPERHGYRSFSKQLKSLQISINDTDPTLKKYITKGKLSNKFNPTDLGYRETLYQNLSTIYPIMDSTNYSGMKSHKFLDYVNNPKFKSMLSKAGIK